MSTEANKALVRRYYNEVVNERKLAVIDELFAPGFTARASNYPPVGLDQFRQALGMSHNSFPDLKITVEDQIAEGDKVVTRWTARATHKGSFIGIEPTGKTLTLTAIHIHRVADNRIAELWEEINLLNVIQPDGNLGELIQKLRK